MEYVEGAKGDDYVGRWVFESLDGKQVFLPARCDVTITVTRKVSSLTTGELAHALQCLSTIPGLDPIISDFFSDVAKYNAKELDAQRYLLRVVSSKMGLNQVIIVGDTGELFDVDFSDLESMLFEAAIRMVAKRFTDIMPNHLKALLFSELRSDAKRKALVSVAPTFQFLDSPAAHVEELDDRVCVFFCFNSKNSFLKGIHKDKQKSDSPLGRVMLTERVPSQTYTGLHSVQRTGILLSLYVNDHPEVQSVMLCLEIERRKGSA
jgi:hypothetical protein